MCRKQFAKAVGMERTKAVRGIASNSVLPTFTAVTRDSVVPEHPRAERGDVAQALPDLSLFQQPPPLSRAAGDVTETEQRVGWI